ncbi:MAG: prepilin-type N-terminal cleavage/methylation domain-containing protein [Candidatus Omnitrophota bacterium]|jgi:prepilin-type N-terminal cleavage/methylation domain-containing protein
MKKIKAMTLMEIIIVIVLIGILSMAGVVGYRRTVLSARDREAQAMLRLITHAEDVWRIETNNYIACANTAACNATLRLSLPDPAAATWVYSVGQITVDPDSFCTQAAAGPQGAGNGFHIRRNATTGVNESNQNPLPAGPC